MRIQLFVMLIGAMFIRHAGAASSAAVIDPISIAVRVYDGAGIGSVHRAAAIAVADTILSAAFIDVEWRTCDVDARRAAGPCAVPLGKREFALRLIGGMAAPDANGQLALGYSLIDTRTRAGSLATIHPDRVAWLADAAGFDVRTLLGRAIAHEIGHLLLGSNDHRGTGIMRAVWSREALQRNAREDWVFSERDAADMQTALRARTVPPQVAASIVWSTR